MGAPEFAILGPLEVRLDGAAEPLALGGLRQRALLAVLLLHPNAVVSTDRLIDELWGERPPARALHTIQVFVSRLRGALGDAGSRLITRAPGYVLEVGPDELDADRCERCYDAARRALAAGFPQQAAELLRDAEALWRGPPLADFTYEPFAQAAIARLDELRIGCLEELIEAELALGGHAAVAPRLEALVREHPLRERPRGQLMLALYRAGRQAEALEVFQEARRTLVEQLAVEPSAALRELEEAILRQDPALLEGVEAEGPVGVAPAAAAAPAAESAAAAAEPAPAAESAVAVAPAAHAPPGVDAPPSASEPAARTPARKIVSVLSCEIAASRAAGGHLDPEVRQMLMDACFSEMRTAVDRHGGALGRFVRGAMLAVFGAAQMREDDALRATRAAAEIRERLAAAAHPPGVVLSVRAGISTGLVLTGEAGELPSGEPLDVAAWLAHAAADGEIVLCGTTHGLVRDAVTVEPVALEPPGGETGAVRLMEVDPVAEGIARRFDSVLVDRLRELPLLRGAWERVREEADCYLCTLLGAAGVGKSRLSAELLAEVGEAAIVLRGRCLPYGEGITFWPVIEALAPLGEQADAVCERLRSGGTATPEEVFWEVRVLLESLAAERPVILHIDDLQWGADMLLDLIEHIVDLSRGAPILVLTTARLELVEDRPAWSGGKLNATTLQLQPLARSDGELLIDQIGEGLDPEARAQLVIASEGNPLYLEEMVAYARERGTVAVPPTIQALLAARLETLAPEERDLLELAAIAGEQFTREAILALEADVQGASIDTILAALVRKDLIRPLSPHRGRRRFRFRHLLIRDAAYAHMPKARRYRLHARFARWLEATADELLEYDEIAGWHAEQSVRYQRALGLGIDAELARAGAGHLHTAGLRARERSDPGAARSLLERALELVEADDELRIRIGVELAEVLIEAGELRRADELLTAAERGHVARGVAALSRFEWLIRVRPEGAPTLIQTRLAGILGQLSREGDERGIAKAHLAARLVHVVTSQSTAAAEAARLAAEHAARAGDEGLRARALGLYVTSIMYGSESATAMGRELEAIGPAQPGSYLAARVALCRGELARLDGRFDDARDGHRRAIATFRALGMPVDEAACEQDLGRAELSAGDPRAALAALTRSDELLARFGERPRRSTTQAHMAEAYVQLGLPDAARVALESVEELGAPEDVLNPTITHQARAWLAFEDGDAEAAVRSAEDAVRCAAQTDYVVFQAGAYLTLARIEAAIGRAGEGVEHAERALELFSAKGDRPGAAQARAVLRDLAAGL